MISLGVSPLSPGGLSEPTSAAQVVPPQANHQRVKRVAKDTSDRKPKRTKSAYLFFNVEKRAELYGAMPGRSGVPWEQQQEVFKSVAKRVGAMWQSLGEEARKPYATLQEKDAERYAAEMAVWDAAAPVREAQADAVRVGSVFAAATAGVIAAEAAVLAAATSLDWAGRSTDDASEPRELSVSRLEEVVIL